MTEFPKVPGDSDAGSDDTLFELDDADFQPVEPTGKIKVPGPSPSPLSTQTVRAVTGEINPELTPMPKASPIAPLPPETTAGGAKNRGARQALQEALEQLQKNKQSKSPVSPPGPAAVDPAQPSLRPPPPAAPRERPIVPEGRAEAEHHVSPEEDLTPLPAPSPLAAPWQAAITSEVALVPSDGGDDAPPDAPTFHETDPAPPSKASAPPPAAPRPSLQEQARLVKGPGAPHPFPAAAPAVLPEGETTAPSVTKGLPQELNFQQPLLTPLAGSPQSETHLSQTTEHLINRAMPPSSAVTETVPPAGTPETPTRAQQAPLEEAPAMMDMMPSEPSGTFGGGTDAEATAAAAAAAMMGAPEGFAYGTDATASRADADRATRAEPDMRADDAQQTPGVTARSATEPMPETARAAPPDMRARLKRGAPVAAGALALAALAALLVVRHHRVAEPPPQVAQVAPPAAPKAAREAHKEKVHAPKPVVPGVTEPLTLESVDRLGYHALAAGVEAAAGNPRTDPGLLLWAQLRLLIRFDETGVKPALARALDGLPLRGRLDVSSPLLTAARAGAAMLTGRYPLAKRLIIALAKSPGAKNWQTLYVQVMWQSRRPMPPARLIPLLERILKASPDNMDVRLWRAEALLRRNVSDGVRAMTELSKRRDPDVIARIAQVFARRGLMQALAGVLEPLDDGSVILQAAPAHQADLLRLYAASRILRGDYEAPRSIAEALARGDGDADAVVVWARLTQYQGDDPGGVLQQGIDAQSDKALRGWLLYEAVRLAIDRHDMNHAKFLADGMNSMPPGDIGVFAPLAAARLAQAQNQPKQVKRYLSAAAGADANNRFVQIALALEQSTSEAPIRWAGAPPVPPEVQWQQAHATAGIGQGGAAAHMAEELFWRDPTLFDPVILLGAWSGWLDQAGESLHAESLLERIAPALSDDDRPVIQLIKQARRGKRYDAAIQWYEVLLKRRPSDPELTVELAKTYIAAQKPEVAAQVLTAAEHADPNVRTPVFMTTMASALSKSDPLKARNLLAVALRVQPSADSYVLLADMENAAGHPEEELRALQAALPLAPDDGPLHLRVATLLRDKRLTNQAMALLQPLTGNGEAMEMLGDLLQESGDLPDALTAYQHADAAYQRADSARSTLAELLVKMGVLQLNGLHDVNASIKTLQKAVSAAPRHAETFFWLSRAFAHSGMRGPTKKLLLKYLRLAPDGPHAEEAKRDLAAGPRRGAAAAPAD